MPSFRRLLRDLPVLPADLPGWHVDDLTALPVDPRRLFEDWFTEAVDAGARAPHAMTLATSDGQGAVHARTVILKDLTENGWWFAGHATSPKGRDLAADPRAALVFLWRETGCQVRVVGRATDRPDVGELDFRDRPAPSRASGLVGHQSEVLGTLAEHRAAWAAALEDTTAAPDRVAPTWTAWVLEPDEVEFWRSGTGTGQTRVRYLRRPDGAWARDLLWP
ncbi:pyridoxine/pyridoxamine 5'-phosphate oxidase [Isoptericola jiangsuensis]|uniref:pyridoxine/pyridoxamine 5'-phosphate oxidase n=1 Tax=Isoptericola jiangsuensis TaxID=548579 RepID=UPI003AAC0F30